MYVALLMPVQPQLRRAVAHQLPIYKAIGYNLTDHKTIPSPWNKYDLWYFYRENEIA